jgi:phage host-nuclease inhibitor protein Gam
MEILERLSTKIDGLKEAYEVLKHENDELKSQLNNSGSLQDEVTRLKSELAQKDAEIEAIIEKVETLLAQ